MKTVNKLISALIILILSIFALSQCDNSKSIRKIKQKLTKARSVIVPSNEAQKQAKNFKNNKNYVFGIDFSHYQGLVHWDKIKHFKNKKEISFAVVRSTMGSNGKDNYFTHNWRSSKRIKIIRGAYHYYRPNENSTQQAQNYIKHVKLKKGDLPPILDIESISRTQSIRSLQSGLKNWLTIIEKHYGVKPIIYSGDRFHELYLRGSEFNSYILWIANYNNVKQPKTKKWRFWQYSEKGRIKGVNTRVDLNVFKGTKEDLEQILIK